MKQVTTLLQLFQAGFVISREGRHSRPKCRAGSQLHLYDLKDLLSTTEAGVRTMTEALSVE